MSEVGPGGKYQNQDPNSQYSDFKADYRVIMRKIFFFREKGSFHSKFPELEAFWTHSIKAQRDRLRWRTRPLASTWQPDALLKFDHHREHGRGPYLSQHIDWAGPSSHWHGVPSLSISEKEIHRLSSRHDRKVYSTLLSEEFLKVVMSPKDEVHIIYLKHRRQKGFEDLARWLRSFELRLLLQRHPHGGSQLSVSPVLKD